MLRTDFPLRKHICRHDPPRSIQTQIGDASDNAGSLFPIRRDNLAYNRVMHLDSVFLAVTDQSLRHLAISPISKRVDGWHITTPCEMRPFASRLPVRFNIDVPPAAESVCGRSAPADGRLADSILGCDGGPSAGCLDIWKVHSTRDDKEAQLNDLRWF